MQLLDQQYFNTPFYGCRKLTFWLKDLGFKVNRKRVRRLMQIINWQTYREPKTTMSNKEHKKHLIYSKIWRAIKISVGNRYHLYSYGKRVYVFNCDYWFAYKICFELSKHTMSADWCADILQETIQKYGVPEILIQIKEVNTPVRFTPMYY
jgi:putative transposase